MTDRTYDLPQPMDVPTADRPLRLAVVYSRVPLPMRRADQMTVAHLLAFLAARGHSVDLYAVGAEGRVQPEHEAWLRRMCRKVTVYEHGWRDRIRAVLTAIPRRVPFQVALFDHPRQRRDLARAAGDYDIVYAYYVRSAEVARGLAAVAPAPPNAPSAPKTFLAYQLSQTLNTERISRNAPNLGYALFYRLESRLMASYEARIWRDFTRSVLIGPADVAAVQASCRAAGVAPIENYVYGAHGTNLDRFRPRDDVASVAGRLVFSGVMRTPTNVNAVQWFAARVWPRVRAARGDATWQIVGREPSAAVRALGELPGVEVVGTVPDPSENIAAAEVCINPMQAGGGMQNKLIEYLASARATVATSVANEGIRAEDGRHLIVADDPQAFAEAVVGLLDDPQARARLAQAGRRFVEENWTWEAHWLKLEQDFYDALDGRPPSRVLSPSEALGTKGEGLVS